MGRSVAFIIPFLFSWLMGVPVFAETTNHEKDASGIRQPVSEQFLRDNLPNRELALSSAQGIFVFGDETSFPQTVRNLTTRGRICFAGKFPFCLFKNTQTPAVQHIPFLSACFFHMSGLFEAGRYLYAIHRMRI